jgi:chromate transporter
VAERTDHPGATPLPARVPSRVLEVFLVALRLGLSSFGGPVAHLGYFRAEYVVRRRWIDDAGYADLVALCQFLPGPASSQVGIAMGVRRAGLGGGLAAWCGFTLPSAAALVAFAYGIRLMDVGGAGWLGGLKVAAVAVVAQAVWGMGSVLAAERLRASLMLLAAIAMLAARTALSQVLVIAAAGLLGWRLLAGAGRHEGRPEPVPVGPALGAVALALFAGLLVALPVARAVWPAPALALADSFYRTGSLVFGGGHVVLPLLQAEVVPPGWVSTEQFLAGYGATQAVPGPLFTFAAYLGAVAQGPPGGLAGAALALGAIFLPGFLLVVGALPFWEAVRGRPGVQAALAGINAAVVGLLLAALYDPVWTGAIHGPADLGLALVAFGLLVVWRLPPWIVVGICAAGGAVLGT